jgi:hypothetical protein
MRLLSVTQQSPEMTLVRIAGGPQAFRVHAGSGDTLVVLDRRTFDLGVVELSAAKLRIFSVNTPEVARAKDFYTALDSRTKAALQAAGKPTARIASGLVVLASAASETGFVYTALAPYHRSQGIVVLEIDPQDGSVLRRLQCALPEGPRGRMAVRALASAAGKLFISSPEGQIATFSIGR